MALQTIISNYQDVRTELECCFLLLLFLLSKGRSKWALDSLDDNHVAQFRRGAFCVVNGWEYILEDIPGEAHAKLTKMRDLFYPGGQHNLSSVSYVTFSALF